MIAHLEQHMRNQEKQKRTTCFLSDSRRYVVFFHVWKKQMNIFGEGGGDVSSMAYSFKTNRLISILTEILSPSFWIV